MTRTFILKQVWSRWLFACCALAAATVVNIVLQPLVAGRTPLLPYFPALVLTGLCAGMAPGLAVLVVADCLVLTFWIEPFGTFWPPAHHIDLLIIGIFAVVGAIAVAVSAWARHLVLDADKNRARLQMALQAGRMTTWDWDVTTDRVRMAPSASRVFGLRFSEAKTGWDMTHPDDAGRMTTIIEAAMKHGTEYSFAHRIFTGDTKQLRWVETTGHIHRNLAGTAVRVSGVTVDVTDRQNALIASQTAEQRLELALRAGKVTVWETDPQARFTGVHNLQRGLKAADLIGRLVGDALPNHGLLKNLERVHATGEPAQFELEVPHADHVLHYLVSANAEKDATGKVVRVVGASVDVTELKVVQEKLRQEGERKDTFLATLAHELRNPMAPIRYAVAMLGDDSAPALRAQARTVIARQASHMSRLLDDLLDMSRITRNAIELRLEVLDLRTVAEQAAENVRATYSELKRRLVLSLPPEPIQVKGDATRLQQVLGNLLDNAAKYSDEGAEVMLRLDVEDSEAVLRIKDTGIGIAPEQVKHVFELFTQVEPSGRGRGGLGIGLAVVRQLVNLHGGTVSAASEGKGLGSEFSVRLPLAMSASVPSHRVTENVVALFQQAQTALVVDDSVDAADMLAVLLRAQGYAVTTAYDGASALQGFHSIKPAIVLLDLGLPDITGLEVAREMRRTSGRNVTLIAVSGWGRQSDRAESDAAGFDLHLVKPVDPEQLLSILGKLDTRRASAA